MSLSILIPVYNFDINELVFALLSQVRLQKKTVEIILLDDCSGAGFKNQYMHFVNTPEVKVFFNTENRGRQLARKKLATLAAYENILFLDCDMVIIKPNFIQQYNQIIKNDFSVCSGSHVYSKTKPDDKSRLLHWKYGSNRETRQKNERQKHFTSGNFLIKKNIFNAVPVLQSFGGYGHEDTFWGMWFYNNNYPVKNIDNPVLHAGVETNAVFLKKSMEALVNLKDLAMQTDPELLAKHVKLYYWYLGCKRYKLLEMVVFFNKIFKNSFYKNLYSANPSLKIFDFVRLAYFIQLFN